jgi:hypothetical protein
MFTRYNYSANCEEKSLAYVDKLNKIEYITDGKNKYRM